MNKLVLIDGAFYSTLPFQRKLKYRKEDVINHENRPRSDWWMEMRAEKEEVNLNFSAQIVSTSSRNIISMQNAGNFAEFDDAKERTANICPQIVGKIPR